MFALTAEEQQALIALANEARRRAYAPYSHYLVGAALDDLSWLDEVPREREFEVLAVVTSNGGSPCGGCRQVLAEFGLDTLVLIADADGKLVQETSVAGLLPGAFTPKDLPDR